MEITEALFLIGSGSAAVAQPAPACIDGVISEGAVCSTSAMTASPRLQLSLAGLGSISLQAIAIDLPATYQLGSYEVFAGPTEDALERCLQSAAGMGQTLIARKCEFANPKLVQLRLPGPARLLTLLEVRLYAIAAPHPPPPPQSPPPSPPPPHQTLTVSAAADESAMRDMLARALLAQPGTPIHVEIAADFVLTSTLVFNSSTVAASEVWIDGGGTSTFRWAAVSTGASSGRRRLASNRAPVIRIDGGPKVNLVGLRLIGSDLHPAVDATSNATLSIHACNFSGNAGGALRVTHATAAISDSSFIGNGAEDGIGCGGALTVQDGSVTVNRSFFATNRNRDGGAVCAHGSGAVVSVSDSIFDANSAGRFGGALFLSGGSRVELADRTHVRGGDAQSGRSIYVASPDCGVTYALPAPYAAATHAMHASIPVPAAPILSPCRGILLPNSFAPGLEPPSGMVTMRSATRWGVLPSTKAFRTTAQLVCTETATTLPRKARRRAPESALLLITAPRAPRLHLSAPQVTFAPLDHRPCNSAVPGPLVTAQGSCRSPNAKHVLVGTSALLGPRTQKHVQREPMVMPLASAISSALAAAILAISAQLAV